MCDFSLTFGRSWLAGVESKCVLKSVSISVDFPIPVSPTNTYEPIPFYSKIIKILDLYWINPNLLNCIWWLPVQTIPNKKKWCFSVWLIYLIFHRLFCSLSSSHDWSYQNYSAIRWIKWCLYNHQNTDWNLIITLVLGSIVNQCYNRLGYDEGGLYIEG